MKFNLTQKLTLVFVIFAAVLLLAGSVVAFVGLRSVLISNVTAEITTISLEKQAQMDSWFTERIADINIIASKGSLISNTERVLDDQSALVSYYSEILTRELKNNINPYGGFTKLVIVDARNGAVVASTDPADAGRRLNDQLFFEGARESVYIQPPVMDSPLLDPELIIAVPIMRNGSTIGILAGRLEVDSLREIIARRSEIHDTDEAILINQDGYFVTRPRLAVNVNVLLNGTDDIATKRCLDGKSGVITAPDYRSIKAATSYTWLAKYHLCLLVKEDEAEALEPVGLAGAAISIIAVLILVFAGVVSFWLARTITLPLVKLRDGAERMGQGDLSVRMEVRGRDEIGLLANTFNVMASAISEQDKRLREYTTELEKKVEERTAALRANEALSRAVIEYSPVGISVRDKNGKLLFGNDAWLNIGATDREHLEESESRFMQMSMRERYDYLGPLSENVVEIYEQGGSLFIPEIETNDKQPGAVHWISQHFYGITNDKGEVERVVSLTQDITERKEREYETQILTTLSSALRIAVTRTEMQSIILEQLENLLQVKGVGLAMHDNSAEGFMVAYGRGEWESWNNDGVSQPADTGIVGHVMRTRQMYVSNNVHTDPRLWGNFLGDIKSLAAVPLIARDKAIGMLVIGGQLPFKESQLRILKAVGDIVANALYRVTLYEQTERRLQWLTAIRTIDQAIMGSMDMRITFNVLLDKTISQLGVDAASIMLLKQDNHLVTTATRGFKNPKDILASLRLGEPQAGKAAFEQRTILIQDYTASDWKCEMMELEGFHGYCGVPLIAKGQVKGVLEVFSTRALLVDPEWVEFLESLAGLAAISIDNASLIDTVQRTNLELSVAYDTTLEGWSRTIEMRDHHSRGHSMRIAESTVQLARELGVPDQELVNIRRGALLHDIGTIAIPESVINKTEPLNVEERKIIETHPVHSYQILLPIDMLRSALDVPYCHHEKWDGSGYPRGLKGDAIPLSARIFAIVETWDALTHDRPYRAAWFESEAVKYIRENSGKHFDPQVVDAFLRMIGQ